MENHDGNADPIHRDGERSNGRCLQRSLTATVLGASLVLGACNTTYPGAETTSQTLVDTVPVSATTIDLPRYCSAPDAGILESVVRVSTLGGNEGSGVVIAFDRVLTAAHVVTSEENALVFINGAYREARVLASDIENDLAILEVDTQQLQPIRVARTDLISHETVWTVGFPLALDQVANSGHYQHVVNGAIYASASTNAGASGGGLLRCDDGQFELAGMIRGYGAYWRGGELLRIKDLSISVPAETIAEFAYRTGVQLLASNSTL